MLRWLLHGSTVLVGHRFLSVKEERIYDTSFGTLDFCQSINTDHQIYLKKVKINPDEKYLLGCISPWCANIADMHCARKATGTF